MKRAISLLFWLLAVIIVMFYALDRQGQKLGNTGAAIHSRSATLITAMRNVQYSGQRAGYFYGWMLHSRSCIGWGDNAEAIGLKRLMNLSDQLSRNALSWTGFDSGKNSGDVDAARLIAKEGQDFYCATTLDAGDKISYSFLNETLN